MWSDRLAGVLIKDGKKNWAVILVCSLVLLLPVLFIAGFSYFKTYQDLTDITLSKRQAIAYLGAATLKEKLDRLTDLSISLASRVRFRQLVGAGKWQEAIDILRNVPRDFPLIDRLTINDPQGTLMADIPLVPAVRGKNFAHRDWYRGVSKNWTPYVSEVYQRAAAPRYNVIAVATPIKDQDERVKAILVLQVKLDSLLQWAKDIQVGADGFVFVVDKKGKIAAHPKFNLQGEIIDYSKNLAVQKVLRGAQGVEVLYDSVEKASQVVAYQPVSGHGWGIVVQQPTLTAFAIRNGSLKLILTTYGFILLLNCGLAYVILNSLIRTKRAEESRSKLASIVEFSDDAIIGITLEGSFSAWNKGAETICGYVTEEVMDRSMSLLVPPDQVNEFPKMVDKIRGGEVVPHYETLWVRKDGQRVDVSLTVSPIRDGAGKIVGASVIGRDVAERKRFRDELKKKNRELEEKNQLVQEANRLKSEFLANMSHELRTPLNGIIGFSQLMHDGKVGPVSAEHKEYLGDILTSSRHLLQLINDILDLAKIEAGKMEFTPEAVQLSRIVSEVHGILRSLAASKRLTINVEVSPDVNQVVIDPAKLKQVLYNYLSNAIKFTPEEGRISVRALPESAEFFRLEVEDTGGGIALRQMDKLFTEFQQLDAGMAKKHAGTGLGLALTKKIVEGQGGRVGAESTLGQGSLFYAILPRIPTANYPTAEHPSPRLPSNTVAPRVLIVEDDEKDRNWLAEILSQAGYAIDGAKTGAEALAKVEAETYSAILLDLILPDMIGWDVLHSTRTTTRNQYVPVIVISVVNEQEVAKGFPVQDYLAKPVSPDKLIHSLRSAGVRPNGAAKKILVIDDDPNALKIATAALRAGGYEAVCHMSGAAGLTAAAESEFAAVVLDLLMPGIDGFKFLDRFREIAARRDTPVIVWTNKDITVQEKERLKRSAQSITLKSPDGIDDVLRELQRYVAPAAVRPPPAPPEEPMEL